ncbi:uncharacterized protein IWZ02DRAFT_505328 [Phyllosticta citriasiana]|uniref:uncharacterized protein n=1 Tax=Phyllosticta citriasiana TaxID=595635 RepID=UPI0030FD806D
MLHRMSLIPLYIFFILAAVPLARPYPLSTQPTPDATAPEIATTTHEEIPRCPAGPGNGDLYGLGIRLGIYLQWLASHITHTVSPASAAATHDANSVFLLAILIALTTGTARRSKWIRAEEAYIVLLVAWGFVGTVVGVAGVRLRGLEGSSVCGWVWVKKRLCDWIRKRRARGKSKEKTKGSPHGEGRLASFRRWTRTMRLSEMKTHSRRRRKRVLRLTLGAASVVKHPSFSWAGVFWRSSILSYLAALNAWVWWSGVEEWQLSRARGAGGGKAFAQAPTWASDGCVHVVFFFGAHALEQGALMRVLRVVSLVLAVPALVFSVAIALVAAVLLRFVVQTEGDDFITSLSLRNTEDTPTRRHPFSWLHLLRRPTKSASSKPVKTQARSKPKSKSGQRSAPAHTENDNDNVPKPLRRVRRSSSWSLAAASSAVGKPFLLGVRDVVTQWFVRKEAEQLRMGREREDEDEQRQQRGEEERGQDLAVVWKPFMTLMMNRGEGEGEVKGEESNSSASHAATISASSNQNHRHCKHSTKPKPEPRHYHHHHHPDPLPHHHTIHFLPQILHILPLAAFIISIEASLRLARLTAVNDLSSIGQLIPFIIGLASFAASLREVMLVVYRLRPGTEYGHFYLSPKRAIVSQLPT